MVTVGFIGLGSQGAGMAHRIIEQGVPTTLWARHAATLEPFVGKASFSSDPAHLGRASDVVGICVTDGTAVREVTLGPRGALTGMREGSVLAIHSTISPGDCREIADAAAPRGISVIDAPVSGGGAAATAGNLTVYVGGSHDAVERARPVLETYGNPILHMGALGAGLHAKLLNNALIAAHFTLAHDSMKIGIEAGLDPDRLGDALRSGSGRSFALELFVAMGSFDVFADQVGPIMSKDVGLFACETGGSPDRAVLLQAADRFVELLGYRRPLVKGGSK